MFSIAIAVSLAGTLVVPLWLLVLGPLIYGVPHVVSDLRYLVVRTGFASRRSLWACGGIPLVWLSMGGNLLWGFVGCVAVCVCARAPSWKRAVAATMFAAVGVAVAQLGSLADIAFGHAHNAIAIVIWWRWRPRGSRLHWIPLLAVALSIALLFCPIAIDLVVATGGLANVPGATSVDLELSRLAPSLAPELGLRWVLAFCFLQSIHYAVWLQLIPDEARTRSTVMSFRATFEDLRRDLSTAGIVVTLLLAAGLMLWAVVDLGDAGRGYFRAVRFHGILELMALSLLALERSRHTANSAHNRQRA